MLRNRLPGSVLVLCLAHSLCTCVFDSTTLYMAFCSSIPYSLCLLTRLTSSPCPYTLCHPVAVLQQLAHSPLHLLSQSSVHLPCIGCCCHALAVHLQCTIHIGDPTHACTARFTDMTRWRTTNLHACTSTTSHVGPSQVQQWCMTSKRQQQPCADGHSPEFWVRG